MGTVTRNGNHSTQKPKIRKVLKKIGNQSNARSVHKKCVRRAYWCSVYRERIGEVCTESVLVKCVQRDDL
jgi:hypothetical protein